MYSSFKVIIFIDSKMYQVKIQKKKKKGDPITQNSG